MVAGRDVRVARLMAEVEQEKRLRLKAEQRASGLKSANQRLQSTVLKLKRRSWTLQARQKMEGERRAVSHLAASKLFVLMGPDAQGIPEALHVASPAIAEREPARGSIGKREGDAQ